MAINTRTRTSAGMETPQETLDRSRALLARTRQNTKPTAQPETAPEKTGPSPELVAMSIANSPAQPTQLSTPVDAPMIQPSMDVELPEPQAPAIQEQFITSLADTVENTRATFENRLQTRRDELAPEIERLTQERDRLLQEGVQPNLVPFREELEKKERERLFINENFEANQRLTNELDTLLTEGNNLIRQMQGIPAANRIVNARVMNAMRDVSARAGVIEAVMSARNAQISQAYTMIDRTTEAIIADRNDQLTYYQALLDVKEQGILDLSKEDEALATEQLELARGDMERAQATADYIKELMIDPESAQFIADAGVTMLDSVETINQKLGQETTRRQVQETKNAYADAGYEYVPFPTDGDTGLLQVELNGQMLNFRVRPGSQLALEMESERALAEQRDRANRDRGVTAGGVNSTTPGTVTYETAVDGVMGTENDPIPALLSSTAGGRLLTQSEAEPLTNAIRVADGLQDLQNTIQASNTDPILGVFKRINPYNLEAATIDAAITQLVPQLARGTYGEVGVLTDADVARYANTLPNLTSTEAQNQAIMALTLRKVRSGFVSQLESMAAAGRDVSGFIDLYEKFNMRISELESQIGVDDTGADFDAEFEEAFGDQANTTNQTNEGGGFWKSVGKFFFGE